ncbi:T9SS type A sorting domain-containing protein [bacterium]|nr:T9SS type A sorting domain-containing protein [bacterium]
MSEYLVENYTGGTWVLAGKSKYFRTLLLDKLVPVCYRGQTITVTVRIALRLLNYGAILGTCECLYPDGIPDGAKSGGNGIKSGEPALTVYPNPARSEITVVLPEESAGYNEISIYSQSGSLMQRSGSGSLPETIDISGLRPGSYYLVVTGSGESLSTTFVKKQ